MCCGKSSQYDIGLHIFRGEFISVFIFYLNHFFIENVPVHNSLSWVGNFSEKFSFIRYNSTLLQIISLSKLSPEAVKYKKKNKNCI